MLWFYFPNKKKLGERFKVTKIIKFSKTNSVENIIFLNYQVNLFFLKKELHFPIMKANNVFCKTCMQC